MYWTLSDSIFLLLVETAVYCSGYYIAKWRYHKSVAPSVEEMRNILENMWSKGWSHGYSSGYKQATNDTLDFINDLKSIKRTKPIRKEKTKMVNMNDMALRITKKEGKKLNLSIAQVKEVLSLTLKEIKLLSVQDLTDLLKRLK